MAVSSVTNILKIVEIEIKIAGIKGTIKLKRKLSISASVKTLFFYNNGGTG